MDFLHNKTIMLCRFIRCQITLYKVVISVKINLVNKLVFKSLFKYSQTF